MENNLKFDILKGTSKDIDELEQFYDKVNDYLASGINYPGWMKGYYPNREVAELGLQSGGLFVLKVDNKIAGSMILNHISAPAYNQVDWGVKAQPEEVLSIHTFAVNPEFMKLGIAKKMLAFVKEYAVENYMKAIRLDVSMYNSPAIALYEKSGYKYIDTIDLGIKHPYLKWFKVYELAL